MDYHQNFIDSINPTGGSFIEHNAADQSAPTYRAPASDASAETKKRQKLLAELQQALADLPSEKALQIVDAQLPQDYPQRDILLGQLAEALDEQQIGSAADVYAARLYAAQRPQPAPTQHPDRADGMTAEFDHSPLEPVPQAPPEEAELPEETNDDQPQTSQEVTEELFTAFADFIGSLADVQKEQLRELLT